MNRSRIGPAARMSASDPDRSGPAPAPPVAGGGLLDRRLFLRGGLVLSGIGLSASASSAAALAPTAAPDGDPPLPPCMRTPGQPVINYGLPSPQQRGVARWISANRGVAGNGVSWTPLHDLEGTITPTGLHFERHHNGVPQIPIEQHRLLIHGLVRRPLTFSVESLSRYPMRSQILFVECGGNSNAGWHQLPQQTRAGFLHGLASCSEWAGVPLATLLDEAGVDASAGWIIAEGADAAAIQVSLPLGKAMKDCLLALYQNGERIRPENGYPLRLIVPGWEGVLNIKWLRRLELSREPVMARNETARYTELLPSGKARMFTFVMDAKSLITSPSPGQQLQGKGVYEIRGLAWTGRGRIRSVEVSADAGASWAAAELQEPVLPTSFTRFRIPWRWTGAPAVLKSRAVDETGYVQPERQVLVAERGRRGYFHYNAIVSWEVDEDGEISHVYR
jgi:sulfane dehydrogenase subunit SoxC